MEFILSFLMLVMLVTLTRASLGEESANRVLPFVVVAFIGRLVVHVVVLRSGLLVYGGDSITYEGLAHVIASIWRANGISFITDADLPELKSVAVPVNIFAFFDLLCGDAAPLACTAFVAFIATSLCLVIHQFAKLIGADDTAARRLFLITLFGPSFFIHTSDMYKDGINAFLVVAALFLAVQVSRKVSLARIALMGPLLWCLWYVRPYMVFMCAAPLAIGIVGLKRALSVWGVGLMVLALVGGLMIGGGEDKQPAALEFAEDQFNRASSTAVRDDNAAGGSGVTFDDGGSAWGALGPKLVYTILAPFPWSSGSVAFQLGKVETMLWYYLLYCALRGLPWFWKNDRETLLVIGVFVVPSTLAYATSMSNIGLMFRQRMPITIVVSLLSALVWTKDAEKELRQARALRAAST